MRPSRKIALIALTALLVMSLSIGATWASAREDEKRELDKEKVDPNTNPVANEGYHFEYDRGLYHSYLINKVSDENSGSYFKFDLRSMQGPSLTVDMGKYSPKGSVDLGVKVNFYGLVEFKDMNNNNEFDPLVDKVVSHVPLSDRLYTLGYIKQVEPKEPELDKEAYRKGYQKGYDLGYDIGMKVGIYGIENGLPYSDDPFENMPDEILERVKALIQEQMDKITDRDAGDENVLRSFVKGFIEGLRTGIHDGYRDAYGVENDVDDDVNVERTFYNDTVERPSNTEKDPNRIKEDEKDKGSDKDPEMLPEETPVRRPKAYLKPLKVIQENFTSDGFHIAFGIEDIHGTINFRIGIRAYYGEDGSVIPQAGGIKINIDGYPYRARDTQVALIAEGSSHFQKRNYRGILEENDNDDVIQTTSDVTETEVQDNSRFDPHTLIRHIIPVFVDNEGEVYQPLWQDYHKRIVEDQNLWGYSYTEYHLGGFSFTRDQVPPMVKDEEDPEEEDGEVSEEIDDNDDMINIMPTSNEETSTKDAGSILSSTWVWAAGIGSVLVALGAVAMICILVLTRKR